MRSPVYPDVEMVGISIEGVRIDQCPRSGGHWLDYGELAQLANIDPTTLDQVLREGEQIERLITESSRLCPRDGTPLQQICFPQFNDLKLDVCPQCGGIWLDARELNIALSLLNRPADETPAPTGGVLNLIRRLLAPRSEA